MKGNRIIKIINDTSYSDFTIIKLIYQFMTNKQKYLSEKQQLGIDKIVVRQYARHIIYKAVERDSK